VANDQSVDPGMAVTFTGSVVDGVNKYVGNP
jgi:hypothetical protein